MKTMTVQMPEETYQRIKESSGQAEGFPDPAAGDGAGKGRFFYCGGRR